MREIDITDAEQKLKQLQTAFQPGLIAQEVGLYLQVQTRERYLKAARQTRFSPYSLGMRRENGDIIRPGSLFGIATGLLFRDLTQVPRVTNNVVNIRSDRPYARKVMALFAKKGPFAPRSILFVDNKDREQIRRIILKRVQNAMH